MSDSNHLQLKYKISPLTYVYNKFTSTSSHIESSKYKNVEFKDNVITYDREMVMLNPLPSLISHMLSLPQKVTLNEVGTITATGLEQITTVDSYHIKEKIIVAGNENQISIDINILDMPHLAFEGTIKDVYMKNKVSLIDEDATTNHHVKPTLQGIYDIMKTS
jgi:hypothetical protein